MDSGEHGRNSLWKMGPLLDKVKAVNRHGWVLGNLPSAGPLTTGRAQCRVYTKRILVKPLKMEQNAYRALHARIGTGLFCIAGRLP
jgi:hypothetical protein